MSLVELGIYYLIAINFIAFALFGFDKAQAEQGGWRISERSLLALASWGGFPGALAGRALFRHKTRKQPFTSRLHAAGVTSLALAAFAALTLWGQGIVPLWSLAAGAPADAATGAADNPWAIQRAATLEPAPLAIGCRQARALGIAPIHRGQPMYHPDMDGDGDGIACEPIR